MQPTPLSAQLAELRTAVSAADTRGWILDSVIGMIMACLMRIFDRLEQLLLLWQSGTLPLVQPRAVSPGIRHGIPAPRAPRHRRAPSARPSTDALNPSDDRAPEAAITPAPCPPARWPRLAPPATTRPRSARAPPSQTGRRTKSHTRALIVTI